MRLPRVRFTLRRLMVAVAVVAVVLGARAQLARWAERRRHYEIMADAYSDNPFRQWADLTREQWLARCRQIDEENTHPRPLGLTLVYPPEPAAARGAADRHDRLRKEYEWAYAHPWCPVETDPPIPTAKRR
jgi:hypothetical protein